MDVGTAEVFRGDHFTRGGLHQRRASQEDGALVADDNGLVRHGGHVGAAGGAQAHDDGDLGDVVSGHAGLVEEDAAEVVPVGEDFVLAGQVGAAGIHQVNAGQTVLQGDFLGPQVLFHGQRIVAAAFDGGVVGDDHAFGAGDPAHAGNHTGGGYILAVDVIGGELADLQEGRAVVQQAVDALPGQQFAAGDVAFLVGGAAALLDGGDFVPQVGHGLGHGGLVGLELVGPWVNFALQYCHFLGLEVRGCGPGGMSFRETLRAHPCALVSGRPWPSTFPERHPARSASYFGCLSSLAFLAGDGLCHEAVCYLFRNSSRPISMRRISDVPAPIS